MKSISVLLVGLIASVGFAGCNKNIDTPFYPAKVEPAGDNPLAPPDALQNDPYPEDIRQEHGHDDELGVDYSLARGYVHAPIDKVWSAIKMMPVIVNRRRAASYREEPYVDPVPTPEMPMIPVYDFNLVIRIAVENVITVEYDLTWHHDVVYANDEPNAPIASVVAAYSKSWGTSFINKMYGSVELTVVSDQVTEISIVQKTDATRTTSGDIADWQRDMFNSIVAVSHDQPVPEI